MAIASSILPQMIPLPPASVRVEIPENEWKTCVQSWDLLSRAYLDLPLEVFEISMAPHNSLAEFVTSFLDCMGKAEIDENYLQISATMSLCRSVFLIVHRLFFESSRAAAKTVNWRFLGNLSRVYGRSSHLTSLIEKAWSDHEQTIIRSLNDDYKHDLVSRLENKDTSGIALDETFSSCLLPLIRACPPAGVYLLTGSDLFDALISAYSLGDHYSRPKLVLLAYLCLLAPLQTKIPNQSLLTDRLYSLKSTAQSVRNTLLSDLVSKTPFTARLRKQLKNRNEPHMTSLLASLEAFRTRRGIKSERVSRSNINKGKATIRNKNVHVHRMSLVTQIQDLFPHLGAGFIMKLLDEYADDVEIVTAHLLEDDLPAHLRPLDHSEDIPTDVAETLDPQHMDLAPRTTPPPQDLPHHPPSSITTISTLPIRRNVHDNDAFDNLQIPASQLHFGHRNNDFSHNPTPQDVDSRAASKAAILAALSAFDADDDERDDTYDLADVGGTVDSATGPAGDDEKDTNGARAGGSSQLSDAAEAALFTAFEAEQELFSRNAATRRGAPRAALRERTGLSDEAIEGWAVMVRRDPRRLQRLEAQFTLGDVGARAPAQRELGRTAWRGAGGEAIRTDEEADWASRSGGETVRGAGTARRGRGRARGASSLGGPGRGEQGGVAGSSGDAGTQRSRQRKEASKGSRANHNRREQRAKKMARSGFPG